MKISEAVAMHPQRYAIEVQFDSEAAERAFHDANTELLEGVYANPSITAFMTSGLMRAVGTLPDVKTQLKIRPLHKRMCKGQGVRIAIVDTGINGTLVKVTGEDPPASSRLRRPGTSVSGHGTMVAFNTGLAAPDATILDYALLRSDETKFADLLYDALAVYRQILADFLKEPATPMVVVNCWGLANRCEDAREGTFANYGANPLHEFNKIVARLGAAGADVLFAAGNCGGRCAFPSCGELNLGAGKGILGASSLRDVITVGAVSTKDQLLCYSSQGPGRINAELKPDVVASSHFQGSGIGAQAADTGTSTACAVAAGVVAALRSMPGAEKAEPALIKRALIESARQPGRMARGWNRRTGYGIIDADAAAITLARLLQPSVSTPYPMASASIGANGGGADGAQGGVSLSARSLNARSQS